MAHHKKETKVGTFDVIVGLVVFLVLAKLVSIVAGPDGYAFLKGKLDPSMATELFISGGILIFLWAILGPLVMEPYLNLIYERELKTSGLTLENSELKKEIEKLKTDLAAEIKTAKLDGVRKRDEKIAASKRQATEILEAGKKIADQEWKNLESELLTLKNGLSTSIESEVSSLSAEVLKKVLPSEISNKYLHSIIIIVALAFSLSPELVYASVSSGGDHGPATIDTLLWPAVNFTIFCFLIIHFYKKSARPILRDYRIDVQSNVVKQQNENAVLSSEYEQLQDRLSSITEEKSNIVSELERDGRDLSAMILSTANQDAEKFSEIAKRRFALEAKKISNDAKKSLMDKVINKVSDQLSSSFSVEDDASFIKNTVREDLDKIFAK